MSTPHRAVNGAGAEQILTGEWFELASTLDDGDHHRAIEAIEDLLSLGANNRPHAGMVRSIVRTELKCEWSELPTLSKQLAGPKRKRA